MTDLPSLIELPDGNWIDPTAITAIRYLPMHKAYQERVVIDTSSGNSYITEFGTDANAAIAFRRDIATAVNNARMGMIPFEGC